MTLTHGAPLEVEDLDVTMNCVTFQAPRWCTEQELARLQRRLNERWISYTLERRPLVHSPLPFSWNAKLTIGDREYPFLTYVEGHW